MPDHSLNVFAPELMRILQTLLRPRTNDNSLHTDCTTMDKSSMQSTQSRTGPMAFAAARETVLLASWAAQLTRSCKEALESDRRCGWQRPAQATEGGQRTRWNSATAQHLSQTPMYKQDWEWQKGGGRQNTQAEAGRVHGNMGICFYKDLKWCGRQSAPYVPCRAGRK